jgi:chemotaxis protein histidine kinase CheA
LLATAAGIATLAADEPPRAAAAEDTLAGEDFPVLTEVIDDTGLVDEVTAATQQGRSAAATPSHANSAAVDAQAGAEEPDLEKPGTNAAAPSPPSAGEADPDRRNARADDDDEAQADALEALANALEFEDLSNHVAETVFGQNELDEMSQTLSVPERARRRDGKLTGT